MKLPVYFQVSFSEERNQFNTTQRFCEAVNLFNSFLIQENYHVHTGEYRTLEEELADYVNKNKNNTNIPFVLAINVHGDDQTGVFYDHKHCEVTPQRLKQSLQTLEAWEGPVYVVFSQCFGENYANEYTKIISDPLKVVSLSSSETISLLIKDETMGKAATHTDLSRWLFNTFGSDKERKRRINVSGIGGMGARMQLMSNNMESFDETVFVMAQKQNVFTSEDDNKKDLEPVTPNIALSPVLVIGDGKHIGEGPIVDSHGY